MRLPAIVTLGLVLAASPLVAGCDGRVSEAKAASQPERPIKVETATVAERTIPKTVRLTGNLEANRSSDVAADAAGKVSITFVERGAFVKKGSPLARLDAASASLSAAQASAEAESARAEAELKRSELARTERLHATNAISDAELDRARAQKTSAEQRASSLSARVALSTKTVGDAVIRAPFDGLVAERYVDVGEYVRPDTRIVTLVDVDTLRLQLAVPEAATPAVQKEQRVAFKVASDPDATYTAQVRFVGPQVRRTSRDLLVEAVVDNRDHQLRPGLFATARLHSGEEKALLVPSGAIKKDGVTRRVFVLKQSRLEERVVQLGEAIEGDVVVASGLSAGERVVAKVDDRLRDGLLAE